jgi:hypothetical protein
MSPTFVRTELAREICDALGLKNVVKLDLHFTVHEVAVAEVTFFPEVDGVQQLPAILKRYELREPDTKP